MSDDYPESTAAWCNQHAVRRQECGCTYDDPRGPLWSRVLDRSQLANLPSPEPLIDNTLDLRTVSLLVGAWATGKSFLALDWSLCIATGKAWQGRDVARGRVLYVAAEGAYGLQKRVNAWEVAWQTKVDPDAFYVLPMAVQIASRNSLANLLTITSELQPRLIVVDTLARCAVGLDENSSKDMGLFVRGLDKIRDSMNAGTVLAVHHTGKDKTTARGSSAIEGAMDAVYQLRGDSRLMKLERSKRKDGPVHDQKTLCLEEVPGTDSVVVSTGRVDMTRTLERLMSGFVSTFGTTGASKAELRSVLDMPTGSFHRGLNQALEQGLLINDGTDQRPFYRLGATNV